MPPDYSFISRPPENNAMRPISDMLNIANHAQALQQGAQTLQRGDVALTKERALLQPGIEEGEAKSQSAVIKSKADAMALAKEYTGTALNEAAGLFKNPAIQK